MNIQIPQHAEFATAIGASIEANSRMKSKSAPSY